MGGEPLPKFRSQKTSVTVQPSASKPSASKPSASKPSASLRPRLRRPIEQGSPRLLFAMDWFVSCFAGYFGSKSFRS